jgi:hypothetical protein
MNNVDEISYEFFVNDAKIDKLEEIFELGEQKIVLNLSKKKI